MPTLVAPSARFKPKQAVQQAKIEGVDFRCQSAASKDQNCTKMQTARGGIRRSGANGNYWKSIYDSAHGWDELAAYLDNPSLR
jgi:hypothetical protein